MWELENKNRILEDNLRMLEKKVARQEKPGETRPTIDKNLLNSGGCLLNFGDGVEISAEYLEKVAEIGLDTVKAEIPEEARSLRVIEDAIERMKRKAENAKLV